ncbi:MAG: hypothetical protein QOE70_4054 [Chthoniobacter sp.]|jgi:hypothetical protein|nr:hypothetical protein [Chthoniobacter sp.]
MGTYYFTPAVNNDWGDPANWFSDSGLSVPAGTIPADTDDVVLKGEVNSLGDARTCANLDATDNHAFGTGGFALAVTGLAVFANGSLNTGNISGSVSFTASHNEGNIDGSATFDGNNEGNSSNAGNVAGNAIFNNGAFNGGAGNVGGDSEFNWGAYNSGTCYNATFNRGTVTNPSALTTGTVTGMLTINAEYLFTSEGIGWNYTDNDTAGTRTYAFDGAITNAGTMTQGTFVNGAWNSGTVLGTAQFGEGCHNNSGTVNGNAVFYSANGNSSGIVHGSATFNLGALVDVGSFSYGTVDGTLTINADLSFTSSGSWGSDDTGIAGTRVFTFNGGVNSGIIAGHAVFNGSENHGSVATAAFNGMAAGNRSNGAGVIGDASFTGTAYNDGTVGGNATFEDGSNGGFVGGDATFSGTGVNDNTVTGNVTFHLGTRTDPPGLPTTGTVGGTRTINAAYIFEGGMANWAANDTDILGSRTFTFNGTSYNAGTIAGSSLAIFNGTSVNTSGAYVANATFNESSANQSGATVTGNAVFNGSSANAGTVNGDAIFRDFSQIVSGGSVAMGSDAVFEDSSFWNYGATLSGTATFKTPQSVVATLALVTGASGGVVVPFGDVLGTGLG